MNKQNKPVKIEIPEDLTRLEQELVSVNPEIFKGIDPKKKIEILRSFSVTLIEEKSHSGPLPDPESISQYNSVIPNGADRIMKMAEKQQEHRMSIEKDVVKSQFKQSRLGQVFGLIIGLAGIFGGIYLASIGQNIVGGIIAGGTVVSLVSIFVIGKKAQRKVAE